MDTVVPRMQNAYRLSDILSDASAGKLHDEVRTE